MGILSWLRDRRYQRRHNAALAVLLGHHYFAALPEATRTSVEAAVDANLDRSAIGPGRLFRKWSKPDSGLLDAFPVQRDSDLLAAFRARAMEELGIRMPIPGMTWMELFEPWRASERWLAIGNWVDTGVRGFKGIPVSLLSDFRLDDPATTAAANRLESCGIEVPSSTIVRKAVPIVLRGQGESTEILVFEHPRAGTQLVKGTIEPGESASHAALRELQEESGIEAARITRELGVWPSPKGHAWHFHQVCVEGPLPERWEHFTKDGGGKLFRFRWHRLADEPPESWRPIYREALEFVRAALRRGAHRNEIDSPG